MEGARQLISLGLSQRAPNVFDDPVSFCIYLTHNGAPRLEWNAPLLTCPFGRGQGWIARSFGEVSVRYIET